MWHLHVQISWITYDTTGEQRDNQGPIETERTSSDPTLLVPATDRPPGGEQPSTERPLLVHHRERGENNCAKDGSRALVYRAGFPAPWVGQ